MNKQNEHKASVKSVVEVKAKFKSYLSAENLTEFEVRRRGEKSMEKKKRKDQL